MYIFSKQTFINKYSEIQVDISYFNQDTKQNNATCQNAVISSINTSLTEAVLNWSPSYFANAARYLFHCKIHSLLCCLVIDLVQFLSYCFLSGSDLVTLCSCKTVHHAVHIEPRQLRMIFKTLFLILQWKRRLAALQRSQHRMRTNLAHFHWNPC